MLLIINLMADPKSVPLGRIEAELERSLTAADLYLNG